MGEGSTAFRTALLLLFALVQTFYHVGNLFIFGFKFVHVFVFIDLDLELFEFGDGLCLLLGLVFMDLVELVNTVEHVQDFGLDVYTGFLQLPQLQRECAYFIQTDCSKEVLFELHVPVDVAKEFS